MKSWIPDSLFKTWNETHQQLWDYLSSTLPNMRQPSGGMSVWHEAFRKNLETMENAVKQTLKLQATFLEQWDKQAPGGKDMPEAVNEWARQVHEVMDNWVHVQSRLWDEMFRMMKAAGQTPPGSVTDAPARPGTGKMPANAADANLAGQLQARAGVKGKSTSPKRTTAEGVSARQPEAAQIAPRVTPQASEKDDLKVLAGLGPVTEQRLNASGITSFRQLASLSAEAVKDIETNVLKQPGRFKRYDLIAQAKVEHEKKYRETL